MMDWLYRLWADEQGQDLVEYSLLIVCFTLLVFGVVTGGLPGINVIWRGVNTELTNADAVASGS